MMKQNRDPYKPVDARVDTMLEKVFVYTTALLPVTIHLLTYLETSATVYIS